MRLHGRGRALSVIVALTACDDTETGPLAPDAGAPDAAAPEACPTGEIAVPSGDCRAPGVPPDGCADGFEHDGAAGCTAVLPAAPCAAGEMAVPGEAACRSVGACARGTWGDIETDEATQHVDAAYSGGASDGSASAPWTTIQQAIDAAPSGGLVAVAEGSYLEDIDIAGKSVRLAGRCAGLVEIGGTGAVLHAVSIGAGADGSELADLAVSGPEAGIRVVGAARVTLDRVWVHDLGGAGVAVRSGAGVTVSRSLIDAVSADGVIVASGSSAAVEATVIRGTVPLQSTAVAVFVDSGGSSGTRPSVSVRGSVIEGTEGGGVFVVGSDALIEATVVRDTFHAEFGYGIAIQDDLATGARGSAKIARSVIERSRDSGVFAAGSDLDIVDTVVRDTLPRESTLEAGQAIAVQPSGTSGAPSTLRLASSLLDASHAAGCALMGSVGTVEGTVIRDTRPQEADGQFGRGVNASDAPELGARSSLVLRDSIVERSHDIGLLVDVSDAEIDNVAVLDTYPRAHDGRFGRGLQVQGAGGDVARATVTRSLIERCRDVGIAVVDAEATIDSTVVKGSQPQTDGSLGDGIGAMSVDASTYVGISACRVEANARAGVTSFGAHLEIAGSVLECNPIHLDGEAAPDGAPFVLEDAGGNVCGCGGVSEDCTVLTSTLTPPVPLADAQR